MLARLLRGTGILFGLLVAGGTLVASGACSLGNVTQDDCKSDDECVLAIGPNSTCVAGYCTDPPACSTGHDCRKLGGGGACVDGVCVSAFPKHPQCSTILEPADLADRPLAGPDAPLVIGSIFSIGEAKDEVLTQSVRVAVREINGSDKLNRGQRMAVVVCDNGGENNTATGAARDELNQAALDYLAGTLGVPYIVGPLSSSDSLRLIARLKEKQYPTVIISPSATSPALTDADDRLATNEPGLFWRTCPSDTHQGLVMANDVISPDPVVAGGNVAVAYVSDAYGQGLATVFRERYGLDKSQLFPIEEAKLSDPAALAKLASDVDMYNPAGVLVITVQAGQTVEILKAMVGKPVAGRKFFFTDGAKDATKLLDPNLSSEVKQMIAGSQGTAPASPSGQIYETFRANMQSQFDTDPADFSFTAHAYDATYVGAYGVIWASRQGTDYDGRQVAEGMGRLASGDIIDITSTAWPKGKSTLAAGGNINISGTSGPLNFEPATGEAPGRIEIWAVSNDQFVTVTVKDPP
ncbi:ABC transporter substrate-binding protein [Polyangium jinanense]|uniref:ABC transporter substrate-binding protein n=1 Tax=Polyangium jinanense TaxID=2829994 RepID=A0A9X3X9F6_9BACT|nr:ABC transporter substrate-binding protein [Polyangium jinanense]MDC3960038.1 ABC transporter substrate-binding protein [Polyangium jinanense]MDC3986174.1 ABC transporter substrate-binding protein [Polyangium jinanense]